MKRSWLGPGVCALEGGLPASPLPLPGPPESPALPCPPSPPEPLPLPGRPESLPLPDPPSCLPTLPASAPFECAEEPHADIAVTRMTLSDSEAPVHSSALMRPMLRLARTSREPLVGLRDSCLVLDMYHARSSGCCVLRALVRMRGDLWSFVCILPPDVRSRSDVTSETVRP